MRMTYNKLRQYDTDILKNMIKLNEEYIKKCEEKQEIEHIKFAKEEINKINKILKERGV